MEFLLGLGAVALFCVAALNDFVARRIPNWISLALLVFAGLRLGIQLYDGAPWSAVGADIGVALLTYLVGAVLFGFGLFGGGDVKLLAAGAMWLGADKILDFVLITALAGGLLACAYLAWIALQRLLHKEGSGTVQLPYGMAIAFAGVYLTLGV